MKLRGRNRPTVIPEEPFFSLLQVLMDQNGLRLALLRQTLPPLAGTWKLYTTHGCLVATSARPSGLFKGSQSSPFSGGPRLSRPHWMSSRFLLSPMPEDQPLPSHLYKCEGSGWSSGIGLKRKREDIQCGRDKRGPPENGELWLPLKRPEGRALVATKQPWVVYNFHVPASGGRVCRRRARRRPF